MMVAELPVRENAPWHTWGTSPSVPASSVPEIKKGP